METRNIRRHFERMSGRRVTADRAARRSSWTFVNTHLGGA
jgi:hypothetical protein